MNSKKVALVTGASAGIGKDAAVALQEAGWQVYAGARRVDRMEALKEKGIKVVALDVTDDASMTSCVSQMIQNEGRIDALINNAGYGSYGSLEDIPMEEARRQVEVNLFGLARLTQLVLPNMRERRQGRIINISSIGGKIGEPHGSWYHATKFAVEGLSDSIRMELQQFGIDVVVIQPGAILTEWGGIARESMIEMSGHTAYGDLVKKHAEMQSRYDGKGAPPSVISDAILHACTAKKPKTRYVAGQSAGLMLFLRRIMSDRMFDKFMLGQMK